MLIASRPWIPEEFIVAAVIALIGFVFIVRWHVRRSENQPFSKNPVNWLWLFVAVTPFFTMNHNTQSILAALFRAIILLICIVCLFQFQRIAMTTSSPIKRAFSWLGTILSGAITMVYLARELMKIYWSLSAFF